MAVAGCHEGETSQALRPDAAAVLEEAISIQGKYPQLNAIDGSDNPESRAKNRRTELNVQNRSSQVKCDGQPGLGPGFFFATCDVGARLAAAGRRRYARCTHSAESPG